MAIVKKFLYGQFLADSITIENSCHIRSVTQAQYVQASPPWTTFHRAVRCCHEEHSLQDTKRGIFTLPRSHDSLAGTPKPRSGIKWINLQSMEERTLLDIAVDGRQQGVVRLLLDRKRRRVKEDVLPRRKSKLSLCFRLFFEKIPAVNPGVGGQKRPEKKPAKRKSFSKR